MGRASGGKRGKRSTVRRGYRSQHCESHIGSAPFHRSQICTEKFRAGQTALISSITSGWRRAFGRKAGSFPNGWRCVPNCNGPTLNMETGDGSWTVWTSRKLLLKSNCWSKFSDCRTTGRSGCPIGRLRTRSTMRRMPIIHGSGYGSGMAGKAGGIALETLKAAELYLGRYLMNSVNNLLASMRCCHKAQQAASALRVRIASRRIRWVVQVCWIFPVNERTIWV